MAVTKVQGNTENTLVESCTIGVANSTPCTTKLSLVGFTTPRSEKIVLCLTWLTLIMWAQLSKIIILPRALEDISAFP